MITQKFDLNNSVSNNAPVSYSDWLARNFGKDAVNIPATPHHSSRVNTKSLDLILDEASEEFLKTANTKQYIEQQVSAYSEALGYQIGDCISIRVMPGKNLTVKVRDTETKRDLAFNKVTMEQMYWALNFDLIITGKKDGIFQYVLWTLKKGEDGQYKRNYQHKCWWLKLKSLNDAGYSIYCAFNLGKERTHSNHNDNSTHYITSFVFEKDNGATIQDNLEPFLKFNLVPSLIAFTGGKSYHVYYTLKEPITVESFMSEGLTERQAQDKLQSLFFEIQKRGAKFFDSDPSICNSSRVMRLPGFNHIKFDETTDKIVARPSHIRFDLCDLTARFTVNQLTEKFPVYEPEKNSTNKNSTGERAKSDLRKKGITEQEIGDLDFEAIPTKGSDKESWDIGWYLFKAQKELIAKGVAEGGRAVAAFGVAAGIHTIVDYLAEMGITQFSKDPYEYFETFCQNCTPPLDEWESEKQWLDAGSYRKPLSDRTLEIFQSVTENLISNWEKFGKLQRSFESTKTDIHQYMSDLSKFNADQEFLARYISERLTLPESIGKQEKLGEWVASRTGSGKTTTIKDIALKAKELGLVTIYITCLNSVGLQASHKSNLIHKHHKEGSHVQSLTWAGCIDSLHEVLATFSDDQLKNCVIIIDEVHSVCQELFEGNRLNKSIGYGDYRTRRVAALEALNKLADLAQTLFCFDANLTNLDFEQLSTFFPNFKHTRYKNNSTPDSRKINLYQINPSKKAPKEDSEFAIVHDVSFIDAQFIDLCKSSKEDIPVNQLTAKTFVMASDCAKHLEALGTKLETEGLKVLVVWSGSKNQEDVNQFLKTPDDVAKKYDVVLMSPTALNGLSLDGNFYGAFYVVARGIVDHFGVIQMLGRVRDESVPLTLACSLYNDLTKKPNDFIYPNQILKDCRLNSEWFKQTIQLIRPGIGIYNPEVIEEIGFCLENDGQVRHPIFIRFAQYLSATNYSKQNLFKLVFEHLQNSGFEITHGNQDLEDKSTSNPESIKLEIALNKHNERLRKAIGIEGAEPFLDEMDAMPDIQKAMEVLNDDTSTELELFKAEKTKLNYEFPGVNFDIAFIEAHVVKDQKLLNKIRRRFEVFNPDVAQSKDERAIENNKRGYEGKLLLNYVRSHSSLVSIFRESKIFDFLLNQKLTITKDSPEVREIFDWLLLNKLEVFRELGVAVSEFYSAKDEQRDNKINVLQSILEKIGYRLTLDETKKIKGKKIKYYRVIEENLKCEEIIQSLFKALSDQRQRTLDKKSAQIQPKNWYEEINNDLNFRAKTIVDTVKTLSDWQAYFKKFEGYNSVQAKKDSELWQWLNNPECEYHEQFKEKILPLFS